MRRAPLFAVPILAFALAAGAHAQAPSPRDPPPHDVAVEQLSELLGRAHFLQMLCNGSGDQRWREAMRRMLDLEAPSGPRRGDLARRFNAGFRIGEEGFERCSPAAQEEARALARDGRRLADVIAARQRAQ